MSLQTYIEAWAETIDAILALDLDERQGALETSLPGWRVREILAHLVHLEELAANGEAETSKLSDESRPSALMSSYTEAGVAALADVSVAELLKRLRTAAQQRRAQLEPAPADPTAMADIEPGGVQWNWETLLRNRALDAWMHEQDIRRAIGKPGGQSSAGAQITVRTLAAALPFVIGKRAAAPQGHAVLVEIEGPVAISRTYAVDENGRAGTTDAAPQTTIALSSEAYARLAGGREPLETFEVRVTGDAELAARILANLAVTP